jgi:hypothetical protein
MITKDTVAAEIAADLDNPDSALRAARAESQLASINQRLTGLAARQRALTWAAEFAGNSLLSVKDIRELVEFAYSFQQGAKE